MESWKTYQEQHKNRFLEELLELLRIPSVSAKSEHKDDMIRCAEAIKSRLLEAGADTVDIYPTSGHPVVYGEKKIEPTKTTIDNKLHIPIPPYPPVAG
jgi:acetylornithine deacetylase/succinyl-diaminopimelate desuccinylase-like protein